MRRLPLALLTALAVTATAAPAGATADSFYPRQWALSRIGFDYAWQRGATGSGVLVGIVDSGIDRAHVEFKDRIAATASCVGVGSGSCTTGGDTDHFGHGTHVAGIVAANADNNTGVAGVAPGARLVVAKALDDNGSGDLNDIDTAIKWVVGQGAKVVNLSFGIDSSDTNKQPLLNGSCNQLATSIAWAWNHGAIPVIAAGNESKASSQCTGNANAIVVTATDRDDHIASYANQFNGSLTNVYKWAMAAPGGGGKNAPGAGSGDTCLDVNVVSTYWFAGETDSYACSAGTSMAAPHVAAAAAIIRQLQPSWSNDQVVQHLLSAAAKVGPESSYGSGRLDLAAALTPFNMPVTRSTPTTTTKTTQPPRVGPARVPRPPVRAAAPPPPTTTSTAPPTTTTTLTPTTEPPATTATTAIRIAAGERTGHAARPPKRAAALAVAGFGVVAMASSSTVALRRRRSLRRYQ